MPSTSSVVPQLSYLYDHPLGDKEVVGGGEPMDDNCHGCPDKDADGAVAAAMAGDDAW